MKKNWPFSQNLLLVSIFVTIVAVAAILVITNTTLRSIEENLPNTLVRELTSLDMVIDDLSEVVYAAEMAAAQTSPERMNRLRDTIDKARIGITNLRQTYVFDNLIQASAFHAVVAPAIADLKTWTDEGVSGYSPDSETTVLIIRSRITDAYHKSKHLIRQSRTMAQNRLNEERRRLDRFLLGVNALFVLTFLIALLAVILFIHQHRLKIREIEVLKDLQNQRDLLNSLFENIPLGVTLWSRDGRLLYANPTFTDVTGYSPHDIDNVRDWLNLAYPDPAIRREVVRIVKDHDNLLSSVREFKITCRSGKMKHIEFRGTRLRDDRSLLTLADISERKQAALDLQKNEQLMRAILEANPDPMVMYDPSGFPQFINPAFTEVFGWTLEEVQGKTIPFVPGDQKSITQDKIKEIYDTGKFIRITTRRFTKDGRTLDIFLSAAVTKDDDGKAMGLVVNLADITQRKALEAQYEQAQKMESLGTLAGGIAHDFNNLLSGIYGYLDLARKKNTDLQVADYLNRALNSSNRAKNLTHQLLTFSKGGEPVKKIVPLVPFIQETTQFALSGSSVSCAFSMAPDLWMCDHDQNQIGQVIDNIVINAHHAMPTGGHIRVAASNETVGENTHPGLKAGRYVKISISDTGTGIPEKYLSRIFDPFFTTKHKGSGLGLATSYSIVKRHGGIIEVSSEPGKGSTFHIFLPAASGSSGILPTASELLHEGEGIILIMDDEEMIRDMLSAMLKTMGFSTCTAEDGRAALDLFSALRKDKASLRAVILDLTVPGGMGGKEVIQDIRKVDETIPVFVASGYSEDAAIADPESFGFTASLEKPFTIGELSRMLARYLA